MMICMKSYVFLLSLIILFSNCTKQKSQTSIILDRAAACIEQFPDSSLNILNALKLDNISNDEERAYYALLKSMALDKNYIDVTCDSLTSIAVDYYKIHGTADEKLKAYYYNGKIKSYSGDYEGAMENYIRAEKYVKRSLDDIYIGRLYNAKMNVYKLIYDIEQAIKPAELSAQYYLQAKDTVKYISALNSLSSILLAANKFESLQNTFRRIESLENNMNKSHKNSYYINIINYKIAINDITFKKYVDEYLNCFIDNENYIDWIVVARAYNEMSDYTKALAALDKYRIYKGELESLYYYFASEIYNSVGNYEQAYKYLKYHQDKSSKKYNRLFKSDAKFVEERHSVEEQRVRQKYLIIILVLSIVSLILVAILVSIYLKKLFKTRIEKFKELEEHKNILSNEYEKAITEQNRLRTLISRNKLTKDIIKLLEERLIILNNFIVSDISGTNMDKSLQELKSYLSDNEKFVHSTRMSYELTHPKFISYLKKVGLTQWEIGCCCLYCIGLNGSEISSFLSIKYFYKNSSIIRKKLGVHSSTNIDKFLLEKLNELS